MGSLLCLLSLRAPERLSASATLSSCTTSSALWLLFSSCSQSGPVSRTTLTSSMHTISARGLARPHRSPSNWVQGIHWQERVPRISADAGSGSNKLPLLDGFGSALHDVPCWLLKSTTGVSSIVAKADVHYE